MEDAVEVREDGIAVAVPEQQRRGQGKGNGGEEGDAGRQDAEEEAAPEIPSGSPATGEEGKAEPDEDGDDERPGRELRAPATPSSSPAMAASRDAARLLAGEAVTLR